MIGLPLSSTGSHRSDTELAPGEARNPVTAAGIPNGVAVRTLDVAPPPTAFTALIATE